MTTVNVRRAAPSPDSHCRAATISNLAVNLQATATTLTDECRNRKIVREHLLSMAAATPRRSRDLLPQPPSSSSHQCRIAIPPWTPSTSITAALLHSCQHLVALQSRHRLHHQHSDASSSRCHTARPPQSSSSPPRTSSPLTRTCKQ
ncbi:hypothetical protein LR48_Vigan441s000600 [Vigna angularis]|uniref:Uncharacterized protein n=1 Tax=Phaseolus angularis TaxID=3914 RepID=A0A0L9TBR1_PHAAN|nr:hypothetical protein LR48_Vigan441s000600 [Vigna angularis]